MKKMTQRSAEQVAAKKKENSLNENAGSLIRLVVVGFACIGYSMFIWVRLKEGK